MKQWLYKWLPVIFGCHCRKERSFYYKGVPFPICARCTGELVGIVASIFSCFFFKLPVLTALFLLVPMIIDGVIQMKTSYESNNRRRFITGFLFGYGLFMLFLLTSMGAFEYGRNLVK